MKFTLKTAIIGILVVIVVILYGGFYTLEEGLQAIVVQFGRPVGEPVTEAGLHLKLPFIQEVRRFEKRLLVWDGDPNQITRFQPKGVNSSGWILPLDGELRTRKNSLKM